MSRDNNRAGEGDSLAAAIEFDVNRGDVETANSYLKLIVLSVGLFVMFATAAVVSEPGTESQSPVFALSALVVWIGPPLVFRRVTESKILRAASIIPGWGLLFLFGYGAANYVRKRRRLQSVDSELNDIEQHIREGDRLARNGEYDAAKNAYDHATTAVNETDSDVEEQDHEGRLAILRSLGQTAANKQLASRADVFFDGALQQPGKLEERIERARRHLEQDNYKKALDDYDNAIESLESVRYRLEFAEDKPLPVVKEVLSESERLLDEAKAEREEALAGKEDIAFDQRLADAEAAGERGDDHYSNGDYAAAIDTYDEGIETCEDALSLTDRDGVGNRRAARRLLEDLQRRRAEALLSNIGRQLNSVPSDPEPDEIEAAVDQAMTFLEDAESATVMENQKRDQEIVARNAAKTLVETTEAGLENLVEREIERFETGDYEVARDGFDRGRGIAAQVLETVGSYDVDGDTVADLADLCEQNADNARRALLGIDDGTDSLRRIGEQQAADTVTSPSGGPVSPARASPSRSDVRSSDAVADEVFAGYPVPESIPVAPDIDVDRESLTREKQLGTGGNADVTLTTVDSPEGPVRIALKEPRVQGTVDIDEIDEFVDEAETWEKIDDHEHIVDIVDYGSEPMPWIAMEYMEAGDLSTQTGSVELPQALWSAYVITRAVRHAHRRGIQHYDLKPDNVLLRSVENAWDVPKVTDWGLAKQLIDHSGTIEGYTPVYAAPEQLEPDRHTPDERTDIYQLGVLLYELFTGRPPFEGSTGAVIQAHLNEDPTPASEVNPALPASLDDVLDVALAKDKRDRHESVLYLRDGLMTVAEDVL